MGGTILFGYLFCMTLAAGNFMQSKVNLNLMDGVALIFAVCWALRALNKQIDMTKEFFLDHIDFNRDFEFHEYIPPTGQQFYLPVTSTVITISGIHIMDHTAADSPNSTDLEVVNT